MRGGARGRAGGTGPAVLRAGGRRHGCTPASYRGGRWAPWRLPPVRSQAAPLLLAACQNLMLPLLKASPKKAPHLQELGVQMLAGFLRAQKRRNRVDEDSAAHKSEAGQLVPPLRDLCWKGPPKAAKAAVQAIAALLDGPALDKVGTLKDLCQASTHTHTHTPPRPGDLPLTLPPACCGGCPQELSALVGGLADALDQPSSVDDEYTPARLQALSSVGRVRPGVTEVEVGGGGRDAVQRREGGGDSKTLPPE